MTLLGCLKRGGGGGGLIKPNIIVEENRRGLPRMPKLNILKYWIPNGSRAKTQNSTYFSKISWVLNL